MGLICHENFLQKCRIFFFIKELILSPRVLQINALEFRPLDSRDKYLVVIICTSSE